MTDNISIVPMQDEHVEGFHAALDFVSREKKYLSFLQAPPLDGTRSFVTSMREKGNPQFVVLHEGRVVGWCDISRSTKQTHSHTGSLGIGLLPAYREKGVGRRLMQKTIDAAFEKGMTRIELEVYQTNERARTLYEKMGFVLEGTKKKACQFDGVYQDIYSMALLAPSLQDKTL